MPDNEKEKRRWRFTTPKGDLAKRAGIHPRTVTNWVRNGVIPKNAYIKAGNVLRFDLEAVEKALIENTKEVAS